MTGAGLEVQPPQAAPTTAEHGGTVIVSSTTSDAHIWNLVFLQLLLEEIGFHVVNLGACVPDELLISSCRAQRPDLVVLSSVNGHGYQDGASTARRLRAEPGLIGLPMVIGGKLGISDTEREQHMDGLLAAGFDAVFDDREGGSLAFRGYVAAVSRKREEARELG